MRLQNPDTVMYVLDGTIGQTAYDQVLAFKERIRIGSIIVTKLDGHARGGGALSAYAADPHTHHPPPPREGGSQGFVFVFVFVLSSGHWQRGGGKLSHHSHRHRRAHG